MNSSKFCSLEVQICEPEDAVKMVQDFITHF